VYIAHFLLGRVFAERSDRNIGEIPAEGRGLMSMINCSA
jgi:hypothetical protein